MSGGRLPKRIVSGNLEGAVRRGRGGREKGLTDCVQSDIRNPCTDARQTETCVAPVDASRDFWCAARLFSFVLFFPVQQTTSGIGHRIK